ncbi:hypothetical protein WMY93_029189 [Mugilogobius chulae]|uniref:Uncharacterized protein n=1 Tax=Mugilogobius chulae TaxID=88201 RepID=A0AAW0MTV2_9GOBI
MSSGCKRALVLRLRGFFMCALEGVAPVAELADTKVKVITRVWTIFHTITPKDLANKKLHKQPWSCVLSQFISQAESGQLSGGKEKIVTSACPSLCALQGRGSALKTPMHRAATGAVSFSSSDSYRARHAGTPLTGGSQERAAALHWEMFIVF